MSSRDMQVQQHELSPRVRGRCSDKLALTVLAPELHVKQVCQRASYIHAAEPSHESVPLAL